MLKKKSILSLASAGVVLMAITGAALADTTTTNSTAPSTTTTPVVAHQAHQWQHKGLFSNQALLSLLNIDESTLQKDLKAGQSLADIAGSHEQAVIDLLVKQSTDRIDQAVTSGKLTQDKADQMKANLADQIKKRVEQKSGFAGKGHGGRQGGAEFKAVASFLGVDQQQLMTQLKDGKSLADIAVAQGKTEDALIQQLETTASQHIDQAVTSGKLSQDKADQMKAKLPDRIKQMVEQKGFGKRAGGQHQWKKQQDSNTTTTTDTQVNNNTNNQ